jgi:lipid A 3-O-deacylase
MTKFLAAAVFSLSATAVHAVDSLSVERGNGTRGIDLSWRLGAQWQRHLRWLPSEHWSFFWDASLGEWQSGAGSVSDLGLTPTFRYNLEGRLYLDGAIGVHWLSDTKVGPQVDLSTRFQFGDHLGMGWRFKKYDLSVRLQHLSNAGIENPNPGVNFLQVRLQYWLDRP